MSDHAFVAAPPLLAVMMLGIAACAPSDGDATDTTGSASGAASTSSPAGESSSLSATTGATTDISTESTDAGEQGETSTTTAVSTTDATTTDATTTDATTGDATTSDTTGGPASWCAAHCECLAATCSEVDGYPFADAAACASACEMWGPPEEACFPMWCAEAMRGGGLAVHLCEHAWGEFGLDECPE